MKRIYKAHYNLVTHLSKGYEIAKQDLPEALAEWEAELDELTDRYRYLLREVNQL